VRIQSVNRVVALTLTLKTSAEAMVIKLLPNNELRGNLDQKLSSAEVSLHHLLQVVDFEIVAEILSE
jgi:hypothetical protein